jgi:hypothetical protein
MRVLIAVLSLLAAALPVAAVEVRECDYAADVRSLAEPWEKNARSFYNGAVRIALLDTGGEPVCCSQHLLVLLPNNGGPEGMDQGKICRIVGDREGLGYLGIEMQRMRASYDRRGLLLTFPVHMYGDGIRNRRGVARVRINAGAGTVTAE